MLQNSTKTIDKPRNVPEKLLVFTCCAIRYRYRPATNDFSVIKKMRFMVMTELRGYLSRCKLG